MVTIVHIEQIADPRLDAFRDLRDRERARRTGLFVAEGRSVVRRLAGSARYPVSSLLLSEAALAALMPELDSLPAEVPVYVLRPDAIRETAGFAVHQGCVALARRPAEPETAEVLASNPATVLVLVDLADPDNVGSIFRSALALGGDAVILSSASADPLYRKTIRTSMGAVFDLPYGRSLHVEADVAALRKAGYLTVALTPRRTAVALDGWAKAVPAGRKLALLAGNEGAGLADPLLESAEVLVRIPMRPNVDSLNVQTAVAVVLAGLGRAGA